MSYPAYNDSFSGADVDAAWRERAHAADAAMAEFETLEGAACERDARQASLTHHGTALDPAVFEAGAVMQRATMLRGLLQDASVDFKTQLTATLSQRPRGTPLPMRCNRPPSQQLAPAAPLSGRSTGKRGGSIAAAADGPHDAAVHSSTPAASALSADDDAGKSLGSATGNPALTSKVSGRPRGVAFAFGSRVTPARASIAPPAVLARAAAAAARSAQSELPPTRTAAAKAAQSPVSGASRDGTASRDPVIRGGAAHMPLMSGRSDAAGPQYGARATAPTTSQARLRVERSPSITMDREACRSPSLVHDAEKKTLSMRVGHRARVTDPTMFDWDEVAETWCI
jgi:hypothetical protein